MFSINLPPPLLIALFITNLLIPSYFTNKIFEVNLFRYIFFFTPIVFTFSWTICLKSMFFGLNAAIMWKHYDPELMKKGPPQEFMLLRIIIETSNLYLTCCLFYMLHNPSIYKDYCELLKYVLLMKVSLNLGILLLFRPLSYYFKDFIDLKNYNYIAGPLKIAQRTFVILHMIIFSCCEYYSHINNDVFFIKITDQNLTQLSQIAMSVVAGRLLAGIFTEAMKGRVKGSFPFFLGILTHLLATAILLRKFAMPCAQLYTSLSCDCIDSTRIDLTVSTLLFSFGDACYSHYYLNLNQDFTDQTAEALALVKIGQSLLLSLLSFNLNTGYIVVLTIFYYLCTVNIESQ